MFKGAMVLNLAIRDNNPSKVERATRDIDGDWVGESPTMETTEYLEKGNRQDLSLSMKIKRKLQVLI